MTPEEYIEKRLDDQIEWYGRKSLTAQKVFKRLRLAEIVAAALIPFLSGVLISDPKLFLTGNVIIGLLGISVAVITGFLSLGRHQEHWIGYRAVCEALKREKFLFETKVDPYNSADAFPLLVQRVEALVSSENTQWAQHMLKAEEKHEK